MKRATVILALLFAITTLGVCQTSPFRRVNYQSESNKQTNTGDKKAATSLPSTVGEPPAVSRFLCTPEPSKEQDETSAHSEKEKNNFIRAVASDTYATWALVIVGFGGIVYAARTLGAIKKEEIAVKDVANSAKENAAALMLGDRAWVSFGQPQNLRLVTKIQCHKAGNYRKSGCDLPVNNSGQTIAKVFYRKWELQLGDSDEIPPDGTVYNCGSLETLFDVLAPGEEEISIAELKGGFVSEPSIPAASNGDPQNAIEEGNTYLWLCGVVAYRDAFEVLHETRCCYLWDVQWSNPPKWVKAGPQEYRRAT